MSFTGITTSDMSTILAARAIDAEQIGPPDPPPFVALPGMKAAISHDDLIARQDAGHDHERIVARVNERWHEQHADRLAEHQRWAAGPYQTAIEEMRRAQMEAAAEEARRRARWEELTRERDG